MSEIAINEAFLKRLIDAGSGKPVEFSEAERQTLRALWIGFHKATAITQRKD
jgi:hypothetical protein